MYNKRQDIIEVTANELINSATNGSKLVIDDIAKSLKISKKTIYKLFKNKGVLFKESYGFLKLKFKDKVAQIATNDIGEDQFLVVLKEALCLLNIYRYISKNKRNESFHVNLKHEVASVSNIMKESFFKEVTNDFEITLRTMLYLVCQHYKEFNDLVENRLIDHAVFTDTFVKMWYSRIKPRRTVSTQTLQEYGLVVPQVH